MEKYKKGDRVKLMSMKDEYTDLKEGTKGNVLFVDNIGTIHVQWDDGRTLGVVPGVDEIEKVGRVSSLSV